MKFNTAIAAMMSFIERCIMPRIAVPGRVRDAPPAPLPVAPHIAEELWEYAGGEGWYARRRS